MKKELVEVVGSMRDLGIGIEEVGVILTASDIPNGSMVTKRTGTNIYTLSKEIKIYGEYQQEISQEGISFLIKYNDSRNITAISNDTLLIWITDKNEYYDHLTHEREMDNNK